MRTAKQWAYGAILDYWERWNEARRSMWRKRPRRRAGSAALTFALAAATSIAPPMRYNRGR